jgi:hypothetical protein
MTALVDSSKFPGLDIDFEAIESGASRLETVAGKVRAGGDNVLAAWRPLSSAYEAPESPTLLSVMNPVDTAATAFGNNLDTVAAALRTFVDTARPIKAAIEQYVRDAASLKTNVDNFEPSGFGPITWTETWDQDGDLSGENNRIINGVADQWVKLQQAERECANAIRAVSGLDALHAISGGTDDGLSYGFEDIPDGTELPWGTSGDRGESCAEKTVMFVPDFVWDGVIVDGLYGTVQGLAGMVGFDQDWNHSWDYAGQVWGGIGGLISYNPQSGDWGDWGHAGETWTSAGKDMVAWGEWGDNPGRSAGASLFNIGTFFIPVAGQAIKGAKVGGSVGNVSRVAVNVVDWIDPLTGLAKGSKLALPQLGEIARTFDNIMTPGYFDDIADFTVDLPSFETGTFSFDSPHVDIDADIPAPRPEGAEHLAPVRAPEPAYVGGGSGGGSSGGGIGSGSGGGSSGGSGDGDVPGGHAPGDGSDGGTPGEGDAVPPAGPDAPAGDRTGSDDGNPWNPEMGDPTLSGADSGPDWERDTGSRGNPIDPNYGEVRASSGTLDDAFAHPGIIPESIRDLVTDPEAPYGRGADDQPYTRAEFEARYVDADGFPVYPGNAGATPGLRIDFTDGTTFIEQYGAQLDRMGAPRGDFMSFPETPFEQRSLPPSNLRDPYSIYELSGSLPSGARIEVSEIAPAFGRPGGGLQVRVLDADGAPMTVDQMIDEGVLARTEVDGADGLYTTDAPAPIVPPRR